MENTNSPQTSGDGKSSPHSEGENVLNDAILKSVINERKKSEETKDSTRISIILPTNAYFISGIRDFTLTMVKNMTGFSDQWAFRFQSVVDELCNNAIEFGSDKMSDIRVTFVCKSNEYLEIFVEDTGTGNRMSPEELQKFVEKRKEMNLMEQMKSFRGRGLPQIVANWTDTLEFKKSELGGVCVHVIKYLDRESVSPEPTFKTKQPKQVFKA